MVTGRQRKQAIAVALLVLSLVAPRDAVAQAGTGTLTGRIIDTLGASIPGALVTVTEAATGAVRTTTSDGGWRVPSPRLADRPLYGRCDAERVRAAQGDRRTAGARRSARVSRTSN